MPSDNGNIDVRVVTDVDALRQYEQPWNALVSSARCARPMQTYAWIASHYEHRLRPAERPVCLLALCGTELVGVLPLIESGRSLRQLGRPLLSVPADPHTMAVDALVHADREGEVLPLLLAAAGQAAPGWLYLSFDRLPAGSPTLAWIAANRMAAAATTTPNGVGRHLAVPADFAAWRATLSRNFRSNLGKASNKLKKMADVRFLRVGPEGDPLRNLERFAETEQSSWKGEQGTAIASSASLFAFYRSVAERLARAGWLEWHFLEADGLTLAAHLAIRIGRRITVWKLGYRESHQKLSPGSLLFEWLVAESSRRGDADEIDLLTDFGWYDNWEMAKRSYTKLRLYPWRPLPLLGWYVPDRLRPLARQSTAMRQVVHWIRQLQSREAGGAPSST